MPLPPRCPELNPVENVWQFMHDNWLSSRIFSSYDDIVDHVLRLEQARRSALAHHVHRSASAGIWVLINAHRYNSKYPTQF
jgi:hypothetical protein